MSISKATYLSSLAYFRKRLLAEIGADFVEDPKDGSTLLTPSQSEKIETTMTDEVITDADIDSIFQSSDASGDTTDTSGSDSTDTSGGDSSSDTSSDTPTDTSGESSDTSDGSTDTDTPTDNGTETSDDSTNTTTDSGTETPSN